MTSTESPGDRIRAARKRAHLTQAELADLLHVHRDTVSNWETGKHPPDGSTPLIEDVLHISLSDEVAVAVPETFTLEALQVRLDAAARELNHARAILHVIATEQQG